MIFTYGVAVPPDAARQAQTNGVKIVGFEFVQDVLALLTSRGLSRSELEELVLAVAVGSSSPTKKAGAEQRKTVLIGGATKPRRRDTSGD